MSVAKLHLSHWRKNFAGAVQGSSAALVQSGLEKGVPECDQFNRLRF